MGNKDKARMDFFIGFEPVTQMINVPPAKLRSISGLKQLIYLPELSQNHFP
jgi:hypothetical protein